MSITCRIVVCCDPQAHLDSDSASIKQIKLIDTVFLVFPNKMEGKVFLMSE